MDIMVAATRDELVGLNSRLRKLIEGADPASLDWRPVPETSSIAVLAMHMLGAEEFLVRTAVGQPAPRDREAEFRTAGVDKPVLLARLDEVDSRVRSLVEGVDPATLALVRTGPNWQRTGALCIVHASAHVSEHIGHAELTLQLWKQAVKA